MKLLKYIALALILFNLPTFSLHYLGPSFGSISTVLLFGSIMGFYIVGEKKRPSWPFIVLGILYFCLSSLEYFGKVDELIKDVFRYFIFIICVNEMSQKTSKKELLCFLAIGALSIIINTFVFSDIYGRYSGFYLNPNKAGIICLLGFSLTYIINTTVLKLGLQLLFVLAGFFTLSRSFMLFMVLIVIVSLFSSKKNFQTIGAAIIGILILLTASTLQLNKKRFTAFQSLFSNDVQTQTISENSRNETWASYQENIMNHIVLGKGYRSMQGDKNIVGAGAGVHNTFFMVLGESGVIPFIIIILIYLTLLLNSIKQFYVQPELTYVALALIGYLMIAHNYFDKYDILFVSVWLYNKIKTPTKDIN